jgi:cellulose synthase/poly-beta-1,6-N-acetylglucosamine synthase-like glycosyltransferase
MLGGRWPSVSVIIPAFNEQENIVRCLRGVLRQDYPERQYHVLVVDNGSSDATADLARGLGVRVINFPVGAVGGVRNRGVTASCAEIVAFLDSDCVPSPDWVRQGVQALRNNDSAVAVGGSCMAPTISSWVQQAWAEPLTSNPRKVRALAASSMFVWRKRFLEVGGFDEEMNAGEDDDLSTRLARSGGSLILHPGCSVYHFGWPRSLREVYRRQKWQGFFQMRASNGALSASLIAVHAFSFCALASIIGVPLFLITNWSWAFLPLVCGSMIPILAAAYRSRQVLTWNLKGKRFLQLCPIFFAYYLGRMVGLVNEYRTLLSGRGGEGSKTWTRAG